jgi:hypothetical protein
MERVPINTFWLAPAMAMLLYWGHAFAVNLWVSGLHSYAGV